MTRFGRFEIRGELGRGGMGVVFRAHDPDMDRDVAIKVLRVDPDISAADREEITRRFEREAQAAGSLNHPNIVTHYERGCLQQYQYIVMELVEGRSLHDLMSQDVRPDRSAASTILRQIASALDYAHGRGIVHRDIKPANILIQGDSVAKIADFGVARRLLASAATSASVVIGSPHYMAPEQIEAKSVTGRADQWALAVTAYELLAGRKPFLSDSVAALFQQILAGTPPDPSEFEPAIPAAGRKILEKALSKDPEERFESCTAFVEALNTTLIGGVSSPAIVPARRSGLQGRRAVIAAGIAITLLLGIVVSRNLPQATVSAAPSVEAPESIRPGEIRTNRRDGLSYVWVAPGAFRMGCSIDDANCHDDEQSHEVALSRGYWLGRTEVTVAAYKRFSAATGTPMPASPESDAGWANEARPISNVAWENAGAFCRWAQGRLPTEAEWEFAARAGSSGVRYGALDAISWNRSNSELRAHDVAGKNANALGIYDTIGNTWEWTSDRYDRHYFTKSPLVDPGGPATGDFRVVRGGSWLRDASDQRVSGRYPLLPGSTDHAVGLRCVLPEMP